VAHDGEEVGARAIGALASRCAASAVARAARSAASSRSRSASAWSRASRRCRRWPRRCPAHRRDPKADVELLVSVEELARVRIAGVGHPRVPGDQAVLGHAREEREQPLADELLGPAPAEMRASADDVGV
jgi:hypothetical protein